MRLHVSIHLPAPTKHRKYYRKSNIIAIESVETKSQLSSHNKNINTKPHKTELQKNDEINEENGTSKMNKKHDDKIKMK